MREQRISRIHRQGQSRPVRIYDLVATDSIESAIARLLNFKSALAAGILDGGPASVRMERSALQRMMTTVESIDRMLPPAPGAGGNAPEGAIPHAATFVNASLPKDPGIPDPRGLGSPDARRTSDPGEMPMRPKGSDRHIGGATHAGSLDLGTTLREAGLIFADLGRLAAAAQITTDPGSGRTVLQMPVPDGAVLARLGSSLLMLQRVISKAVAASC